jgi:membrane fusion protein, copper/silver efflux system
MKHSLRTLLVLLLALAVPLAAFPACSKSPALSMHYHCPMHPTYVSDKPGDCPICGMRLVPIDAQVNATRSNGTALAPPSNAPEHVNAGAPATSEHSVWICPMHPEVVSDVPGRCPKCNMPLEPKSTAENDPLAKAVPGLAPIDVDAEGLRLAGVRTELTERGRIARTIRTVGVVRPDETRVRHVHTKIAGWLEKLFVNSTGESVAKGQPILTIYSPELVAAQHEYLQARKAAGVMQGSEFGALGRGADDLVGAARRRLELLDVPASLVNSLDQGAAPSRVVTIASPVGGVVTSKNAFEGQQVEPGMELFTVTDLSRVWIEADIFESEAPLVTLGQTGRISFPNDPSSAMTGKIKYVYPFLNADTRTLRVRFSFPNPGLRLKLDSYANVEIPVETDEGAIVQDSAILDTGLRQVVFVNTRDGHFDPRLVKVGIRSEGKAQILTGVLPGERVAIKANFLLDSESRLRAAIATRAATDSSAAPATPPNLSGPRR